MTKTKYMFRKIKKVLAFYYSNKKIYHKSKLCGIELKTLSNTIRKKTDKDDAWYFALLQNHTTIFDLGCNIGYTSLLAAIQPNNKKIVLVDPNPEALAKAAQNMIVNGFGFKSTFITAFVGNQDGKKVKFYTVGSGEAGSMYASHAETASAVNSFYEVEEITIDTLVNKVAFIPDLVKIDVEGAESLALEGAVCLAEKQTTKFFIEMHALKERSMKENAALIIDWCDKNHYKAFYLSLMTELDDANMIASRGKCHLLLIPTNEHIPVYLTTIKEGDSLPISIQ